MAQEPDRIRAARCLGQAAPASGAQPAKRRALEHPDPGAVAEALAQAERQPCRLHGRRAVVERAGAKAGASGSDSVPARRSTPPPRQPRRARRQAATASSQTPSWAGAAETCRYPPRRYQASIRCSGAEPPDLVHRVLSGLRDPGRSRPPEALAQGVHAEPHGVGKAAVPSAWAHARSDRPPAGSPWPPAPSCESSQAARIPPCSRPRPRARHSSALPRRKATGGGRRPPRASSRARCASSESV